MPLIDKKPFVRQKPPPDLKPNEELFYCKLTHEVFREYEEFFERVILCNSLVWTCCLTGRPGLTYQEALDSERRAVRLLNKFPVALRKPVLYLATLTQRGRLNDMCDDVFMFVKDHFFVGEMVEVSFNGVKKNCEVTKVIIPEKDPKSPEKAEVNGNLKAKRKLKSVNPAKVKYEVLDTETNLKTVVKAQVVSRVKGSYTRERSKLFLKQHSAPRDGVWKVKDEVIKKVGLQNVKYSDIFVGAAPSFQKSPTKKKTSSSSEKKENTGEKKGLTESGKKNTQGKLNFKRESSEERKNAVSKELAAADWKAIAEKTEMLRKRAEEEKERIKEQKLKEKEKRKEEKRLLSELMNEWKKPRDDLECDDLKNLPVPTPIDCRIPQEIFGDAVMVMEFLASFEEQLHVKDSFPHGFTFEHLEKALVESDIQGPLNDLLECLLSSLFQLQDEVEAEEEDDDESNIPATESSYTPEKAVALASAASSWPMLYHGTILRKMPLDSFSITEILRLHLLASGARRNHNQGQNGLPDDPGLWFKIEEPDLLKKLAVGSVFQLTPGERIKILNLLINQLMSCPIIRDIIDENHAKLGPMVMELKHLRWAYARKIKEGTLSKKKKKEDQVKEPQPVNGEQNPVNGENPVDEELIIIDGEQHPLNGETNLVNGAVDAPGGDQIDEEKEDVENLTPEQQKELEEKKLKEAARQKQEFLRKEKEMVAKIQRIESLNNIKPLGRDRAYRRFWVFQTVPGVFVEDNDPFVGNCLPKGTPLVSTSVFSRDETPISLVRKHLQQINDNINGSSDKENDVKLSLTVIQNDGSSPLKVRRLSDLNSKVDSKQMPLETILHPVQHDEQPCIVCSEKSDVNDSSIKQCSHSKVSSAVFGICSGGVDTCSVHNVNSENRTKWSFFHKQEDLDALIATLNPRGFRERNLKEVLVREKEFLSDSLSKCQCSVLNMTLPPPLLPEVRKSQRLQNSLRPSDFAEMEPEEALELTLRDMILELEQRIYTGGLGSIKVSDHEAWRNIIENRSYEMLCDYLQWGSLKEKIIYSKTLKESCEDGGSSKSSSPSVKQSVKELACALLQVSQGIEARFLHPPLGEDDAFKKAKQKALDRIAAWEARKKSKDSEDGGESEPCPKVPRSPLVRWQASLMECSSLSQLFVHLGTLERSVAWSRSVLKAHCRICRRRGDAENMLLCDGCNRGHHLYCLKPPLTSIPDDDWFCLSCKPPEKVATPKKRKYVSDSESEDEVSEEESESEESDEEVEEEEEEDDDEEEEESEEDESSAVCSSCGDGVGRGRGGSLIHCSDCKTTYHLRCTDLSQLPTEKWQCTPCARKRRRRGSPSSSRPQRQVKIAASKQNLPSGSKVKIAGKKRRRSDSADSDFVPAKRACRDKKQDRAKINETEENPFKKIYRDSAANSERRRIYRFGEDSLDYKSCLDLLVELIRHPSSWPFLVPVNKKDAPDYHQVIKRPMDLGTIRTKLNNMSYRSNNDFVLDIYLVLQNCELFNPKSSPEYKAARTLGKVVERLLDSYKISNPFNSKNKGSHKEATSRH